MISTDRPTDLSDQVDAWLRASLSLAEASNVQEIVTELKKLATRQASPGFQLAFVGEFSRGKSTLINRLLDRPLLPVGALPTTATITSIMAGSEEHMEVLFSDGHQQMRPLEESAWNDLVADDRPELAQKVIAQVRLTVNNAWLQELDVEIIDTPGVDDLSNFRAALVSEILSQADAAVLLVSAVFPLSLTEAAFLEQEVIGKHIPQIIAVVSMLDTLPQEQQTEVFKVAHERVAHVSPLIQVYSAHPISADMSEEEVLGVVRTQIAALVSKSDRRAWRSRQAAAILVGYLEQLIQIGQAAMDAARMDEAARAEASLKAREEIRRVELHWESVGQDFEQRRLQLDSHLRERLREAQSSLVEAATADLNKAPDPKMWWERDFPLRMRRTFFDLARDYEAWLIASLAQDVRWLQEEVARQLDVKLGLPVPITGDPTAITLDTRNIEVADIEQQRFFLRLGTSAAAIAGYLLFAPIGGAVNAVQNVLNIGGAVVGSEALNIAASPLFRKKDEEQRKLLRAEIKRTVERGIEEYTARISTRLRDLYSQVIQDLRREQTIWLGAHRQVLEPGKQTTNNSPWQQLLDEAVKLRNEILPSLAK